MNINCLIYAKSKKFFDEFVPSIQKLQQVLHLNSLKSEIHVGFNLNC